MYTTILQPRLLTLALLIGLYGCASHHRTTRESTTESHTTDKGITSHKVPASPLRPFALGVTLPLLLGVVYLTYRRSKR